MLEKDPLVLEIIYLTMMIQNKTSYCTFVDYSGHVDTLRIEIAESKERYNNSIASAELKFKWDDVSRLEEVKAKLVEILESKEVDTSEMAYTVQKIHHHYF